MEREDIFVIQGTDYKQMTIELLTACDLAGDICRQMAEKLGPDADPGQARIGQGYRNPDGQTDLTGRIGVGNCTKCLERSLGGCPPKAVDIAEFLKKEW